MKIGWLGKNGVQGTNLLDGIISVFGCLKAVQNSYFRFRQAIFRFSGALPCFSICDFPGFVARQLDESNILRIKANHDYLNVKSFKRILSFMYDTCQALHVSIL